MTPTTHTSTDKVPGPGGSGCTADTGSVRAYCRLPCLRPRTHRGPKGGPGPGVWRAAYRARRALAALGPCLFHVALSLGGTVIGGVARHTCSHRLSIVWRRARCLIVLSIFRSIEMRWLEQERQRQQPPRAVVGANADNKPAGSFAYWGEHEGPRPVEDGPVIFARWGGREKAHPVVQDQRSGRVEYRTSEAASRAKCYRVAGRERLQFGNDAPGRPAFGEVAAPSAGRTKRPGQDIIPCCR